MRRPDSSRPADSSLHATFTQSESLADAREPRPWTPRTNMMRSPSMKNASAFGRWFAMSENNSSLDYLANSAFESREIIFDRIAWAFMTAILLAAALGLFGNGFLSQAVLQTEQLRLEYDRFLRFGVLTTLQIEIPPHRSDAGIVAVAFPNSYLHNFRSETIVPDPESSAHGDQTLFWFTATNTGETVTVQMRLEPQKIGSIEGKIFVNGAEAYTFQQFVYP